MLSQNDNRNYFFSKNSTTKRVEYATIENLVGANKTVIDLGCGDGSLMQILSENGNICTGVEISESGIRACRNKNLKVIKGRIDVKLPFKNKTFDYAVCNVSVHMVMYPEILIREMQRVSKKQIITFPNFAFVLNRIQLMFGGTFPKWSLFGYKWYSTGHIHQLSIKDFRQFCKENSIEIIGEYHIFPALMRKYLSKSHIIWLLLSMFSNLFATMAVFETRT